jgi:hypothetical protein
MEYYEYLDTFTGEFKNNQEFIQKCHELFMHASEDRPVKREILLELCPELYVYQMLNKDSHIPLEELYKNLGLKAEEKAKILELESNKESALATSVMVEGRAYPLTPPKGPEQTDYRFRVGAFTAWDPEDTKVQEIFQNEHFSPYEIHRRVIYIWNQIQKTYLESAETIANLEEKLGSVGAVFTYLKVKGQQCTAEEKQIVEGLEYIERLMKEQYEFVQSVYDFHTSNVVLPFPMPKWLQEKFLESMKEMIDKKFFNNLAVAIGIPDNSALMKKELEIREQKARDSMILDERDRATARNLIAEKGDELLVRRDLTAKDDALIKKINFLSDTIKIVKPAEPVPDFTKEYNPEELRLRDNKARIETLNIEELHVENLIKVLYLNNADPQEYNLEFWADNLNISPQRLKNIFYNFSNIVALDGKVIGKLSFIEVPKKKDIFDVYQENLKRELKKGNL